MQLVCSVGNSVWVLATEAPLLLQKAYVCVIPNLGWYGMFFACRIWCIADVSSVSPLICKSGLAGLTEELTLETSATHHPAHHIPQSYSAKTLSFFSKLVFQCLFPTCLQELRLRFYWSVNSTTYENFIRVSQDLAWGVISIKIRTYAAIFNCVDYSIYMYSIVL